MKIALYQRSYGYHDLVKEIEIDVEFDEVYIKEDDVNEEKMMEKIPKDFLPTKPHLILLTKADYNQKGEVIGSTGQRNLKFFRDWAKYFDAYVLEMQR